MKPFILILLPFLAAFLCACGNQIPPPSGEGPSGPRPSDQASGAGAPGMDLHAAAATGQLEEIRKHIEAGTDLNGTDDLSGASPLIVAASFGHTEVAKALIDAGAELDVKNREGSTALLIASFFCHTEIVKALLANGADKNVVNNEGSSPLDSVSGPFEDVKPVYALLQAVLGPAGLELDYEHIQKTRPIIAKLLQ